MKGRSVLFQAGTLRYTRYGLGLLFFWLLWGYFVYLLMEAVIPNLLPLLLKEHQASNAEISFVTSSLNVVGNTFFNPVVSFLSDRHRGRGGRRRPFILYTTPLVVLCLALIPYGPEIAESLEKISAVRQLLNLSPIAPVLLFIGVFVMGFQIFDVFVGSVYHYLVRDTVPEEFLGRFQGLFRLIGGLAPLVFNLGIFGQAESHMKEVFVGVALFYGVGMLVMCWNIREGEYPPPEPVTRWPESSWRARLLGSISHYFKDCLRDPVYWTCFLGIGLSNWSGMSAVFAVLFYRDELGVSLATQGNVHAVNNVLSLLIALPIGYLVDRWNYFRLTQIGGILHGAVCFAGFFLIRDVPSLLVYGIVYTVAKMTFTMGLTRTVIAIYPKEKFGQFGSAGSAFASLGAIGMSLLAAKFVDVCGNYRSFLLWQGAFLIGSGVLFVIVERRWTKLGGWNKYVAP